ncbi:hypothetical protein [Photorhabdus temperata]|uniref:Uncharacterized protein n=2 Tax=Photorhabdus TaxID=29487 RepID=A0A329WXU4_9GAMM|nr:hypothetical protein [Photorhabdus temperata]ERT12046.1 hypothetical protein O185_16355 [Photorhabdus temperata J3]RAX08835.1 hypothetical protein CKY02_18210 [Photorhabdus bodei]
MGTIPKGIAELLAQFDAWFSEAGKWVCKEIIDLVTHQVNYAFSCLHFGGCYSYYSGLGCIL